jgi:hypothetical protein
MEMTKEIEFAQNEIKYLIKKIEELSFLNEVSNSVEIEFDCYAKIEFLFTEQQKRIEMIISLTEELIEKRGKQ